MSRIEGYYELLELSYDEAIAFLIDKYGQAKDDYYREHSYDRF